MTENRGQLTVGGPFTGGPELYKEAEQATRNKQASNQHSSMAPASAPASTFLFEFLSDFSQ